MTAYVISNVRMRPGPALDAYRALASAAIARHGGRYLARGGELDVREGEWRDAAIVVEFPSLAAARDWYASPEYAEALKYRDAAVERDLVIVDGLAQ